MTVSLLFQFRSPFFFFWLLWLRLSRFSRVRLCATPETAAHQAPPSWDSPGKNTGVGCHFLLQCRKVKSESEVAQSCPTLVDPMDCSPPDSSIHGIFQARVLEWGAIRTSKSMLNKSGEGTYLWFVYDLRGKPFSFSALKMMLVVGLLYMAFIMLR